jgi:hypothetical protein
MPGDFTFPGRDQFGFIVVSPAGSPDATLPIAASRAGALGVLNLEFAGECDAALAQAARLSSLGRDPWAALVADEQLLACLLEARLARLEAIVLSGAASTTPASGPT